MELKITDKIIAGRAVLVGVDSFGMAEGDCEISLAELRRLLETAGGETVATLGYSVNAYAYAMSNGATQNEEMKVLAETLYRYGASAENYNNAK